MNFPRERDATLLRQDKFDIITTPKLRTSLTKGREIPLIVMESIVSKLI